MTDWVLYFSSRSPFVRKVVMAAYHTNLLPRIKRVEVSTSPIVPSAEVKEQNPLGMIPTLVIPGGEMLTSSDAILDYFNELEPAAGLIPASGAARREVLRRQAVADGAMDKAVKWLDERFRQQNDDTRTHISGYSSALLAVADWFNDKVTFRELPDAGDLALYCLLGYSDFRFPECDWRDGRSELTSWFDVMDQQPAAQSSRPQMPSQ